MQLRFFSLPLALLILTNVANAESCVTAATCKGQTSLSSGKKIPYYRNFPLGVANDEITRAVIVIHGMNRNADDYFEYAITAIASTGELDRTIVIAPQFQTKIDLPRDNHHFWSKSGWKQGNLSQDNNRYSSFAVIDDVYAKLLSKTTFPNLKEIILSGHSAGGQFVNRYAAGGQGCQQSELQCKYIVMNPSSYLYIDDRRLDRGGEFNIPRDVNGYNDYKYGLDDMNSYMKKNLPEIRKNLFERQIYFLAGSLDTGTKNLDLREEAMVQGQNRHERWEIFTVYSQLFPAWKNSTFTTVTNVGHSGKEMYASKVFTTIVFNK